MVDIIVAMARKVLAVKAWDIMHQTKKIIPFGDATHVTLIYAIAVRTLVVPIAKGSSKY